MEIALASDRLIFRPRGDGPMSLLRTNIFRESWLVLIQRGNQGKLPSHSGEHVVLSCDFAANEVIFIWVAKILFVENSASGCLAKKSG